MDEKTIGITLLFIISILIIIRFITNYFCHYKYLYDVISKNNNNNDNNNNNNNNNLQM